MPIIIAPRNKTLVINGIRGNDDTRRHLHSLGFVSGAEVSLSDENASGVICDIAGARIALDRKTASKISVVEVLA